MRFIFCTINCRKATDFLHDAFPGRVIHIGTHKELAWPARSPDLTILDFFLRGHTKSTIYPPASFRNVADLEQAIANCFQNISVQHNLRDRLTCCIAVEDGLVEQYFYRKRPVITYQ